MTRDDHTVGADEDRVRPAKLQNRGCNLGNLLLGVGAWVPGIG